MQQPNWFEGFKRREINTGESSTVLRIGGKAGAPALVLLHGFPQTHVMWHRVAQRLSDRFTIVMPDLRGYGDSPAPPDAPDHAQASKRALAADVVAALDTLGIERFYLCGHDRGGRVAHRLALDFPQRVLKLCVIDIAPTLDMYARTDFDFARAYYHWFHLIQPAPLPERMIEGNPIPYLHAKLGGWGSRGLDFIEPQAMREYERCFGRPAAIHSACEDYRASAGIDLEHDRASRAVGQLIACDMLVLWGARGVVQRLFDPRALWQEQCAGEVTGQPVDAGHFIPEELPELTSETLAGYMRDAGA